MNDEPCVPVSPKGGGIWLAHYFKVLNGERTQTLPAFGDTTADEAN